MIGLSVWPRCQKRSGRSPGLPSQWHIQDKQVVRPIQNKFTEGRPCLTNLLSFCDKMTRFRDGGKAVDVVYLDFSKAFNTVSHSLPL